jgi:hypothetical protein
MRKLFIISFLAIALPSTLLAAPNLATLERLLGSLSHSIGELRGLAAEARGARGAAQEEALARGRAELERIQPVFQNARREVERLKHEDTMEKWRGRLDRVEDIVDVINKVHELEELEAAGAALRNEFCGPHDLYRWSGDCPAD